FRQGYSSIGGTSNYFANYFINANQHWSSDNGLWFDNVPSLGGEDPLSGHTVPWEVQPAKTDTVLYYAQAGVYTDELYQEGVFKIAANNQNDWMVNIWEDGTYHYLNQQGFPGFSAYDEHPLLFMSASNDNGETWSAPIKLTDINNPDYDFSDEITVFPAVCRRIKNLGDGWGLVTLAYFDDNSFGSYVQGQGDNTGGTIKYMQVKINFADIGNSVSQEPDEHDFNLISNSPNPFKYSTQISLANQTSEKIRNIEIYNIKGQKVKTLSVTDAGSPAISVIWDGTDSENRKVGAGIYYIKLRTDKGVHFKKVVKLSR
ncbi:MAG: T9SS type A sorting domain-containing protein, partial [Candidatus Cloacimonetes bacterium]|nr:T9SS type A sorting domain-containing protein [Candidatus Cloacimonadota bacterium]